MLYHYIYIVGPCIRYIICFEVQGPVSKMNKLWQNRLGAILLDNLIVLYYLVFIMRELKLTWLPN